MNSSVGLFSRVHTINPFNHPAEAMDIVNFYHLNNDAGPVIAKPVNRGKAILSLLLLAAWLVSALPCELRGALFPALDCCSVQDGQHSGKTDCDDCQVCNGVAVNGYAILAIRTTSPGVASMIQADAAVQEEVQDLVLQVPFPARPAVPPGSLSGWQFDLRAALPVRAPSFVS